MARPSKDKKRTRITRETIKELELDLPAKGNLVKWDGDTTGFGVRITASGKIAFVLRYVIDGRERRYTIGQYPALTISAAREQAVSLQGDIAKGIDPLEERQARHQAPTMKVLADDYMKEHAKQFKRESSQGEDQIMLDKYILPKLRNRKVASITVRDIEALHLSLKDKPYRANRLLALLSKMMSLAVKWGHRSDNPVKGIQRYPEEKRERWLSTDELTRLAAAMEGHPNQRAANAVRLLILTGARRSEVLLASWSEFDFERGVWTKPSHHTKQKRSQHVPLSAPALLLLSGMKEKAKTDHLFPSNKPGEPIQEIKKFWAAVCKQAKIQDARLHDLRHTFASHLVSSGASLPLVGRLLGHTQPTTTARYAHLADDPLREASDRFGAMFEAVSNGKKGDVVPFDKQAEK